MYASIYITAYSLEKNVLLHTVKQIRRVCLNPAIQVQIAVGPCCCFILHYCNIIYLQILLLLLLIIIIIIIIQIMKQCAMGTERHYIHHAVRNIQRVTLV